MHRRAKIVCTLGPASESPEKIGQLIDAGMDVARMNFSHNDVDYHRQIFARVRAEADKRGKPVAVLQDLQGPKIRVGRFENGSVDLAEGDAFTITTRKIAGDKRVVSTTYEALPRDVKVGNSLLLDDGQLQLQVTAVVGEDVETRVVVGGKLKNNKGINLPGVAVSAPAMSDRDREHLMHGVDMGVDFIALSFVRHPDDVRHARLLATREGRRRVPIIAKLEKPEAIERLAEIIDVSDGVMVARGDLGVEMGPEKVPLIQKQVVEAANAKGKVVITATQMLESMIENPRPTRAEASDVANAVLDGSDALMLSGETAAGAYPLQAVQTMARIIYEIESSARYRHDRGSQILDLPIQTNAIAHAAVVAAKQLKLKTIAVFSESGAVARLTSEYRPEANIVALTTDASTYRRLQLSWGVSPMLVAPARTTDEMITRIESYLRGRNFAHPGDIVAITMGVPLGSGESTNLLKLHRIG